MLFKLFPQGLFIDVRLCLNHTKKATLDVFLKNSPPLDQPVPDPMHEISFFKYKCYAINLKKVKH